jgi:hypothetical protein
MKAILTFHSFDEAGSPISFQPTQFRTLVDSLARSRKPVLDLDCLLQPAKPAGMSQ